MRIRNLGRAGSPLVTTAFALLIAGAACSPASPSAEELTDAVASAAITDGWTVCAQAFSDFADGIGTKLCEPVTSDLDVLWQRAVADLYSISRPWVMRDGYLDGIIVFDIVPAPRTTPIDEAWVRALFEAQDRVFAFLPGKPYYGRSLKAARSAALQQYEQLRSSLQGTESEGDRDSDGLRRECRALIIARRSDATLAQLADDKAQYAQFDAVLARAEQDFQRIGGMFAGLASRLQGLKGTEAARISELTALVTAGSTASPTALPNVQQGLRAWATSGGSNADSLILDANRAMRALTVATRDYELGIYDLNDFVRSHAIDHPTISPTAARALGNIAAYGEHYRRWIEEQSSRVGEGLNERNEALVELATDAATRETFAQTRFLKAAREFTEDANRRSASLLALPPTSKALKLPLLADKFDDGAAFLQLEPLCTAPILPANSWRQTGCIALQRSFVRAQSYNDRTVPVLLRVNAAAMRRAGVADTEVRAIETALASGNIRAAALQSDRILRARDAATPTPAPLPAPSRGAAPSRAVGGAPNAAIAPTPVAPEDRTAADHCDELCVLGARITEVRAELLNEVARSTGVVGRNASYRRLRDELVEFLKQPFDALSAAALDVILRRHPELPQSERDELARSLGDLHKDAAQLRADVRDLVASITRRARALPTLAESAARANGFDPDAANYQLSVATTDVPAVAIPVVPTSTSYDDATDPYVAYADRILAKLTATTDALGVVQDRAQFLSVVHAWRTNGAVISAAFAGRGATAPTERAAFLRAEQRIAALVHQHLTADDWFIESPVSASTRGFIDGAFGAKFPHVTRSVKDALGSWRTTTLTWEEGLVDETLSGLGRAVSDPAFDSFDAATRNTIASALEGSLGLMSPRSAEIVRSDFAAICEVITTIDGCRNGARGYNDKDRLSTGLTLNINSGQVWRAAGATSRDGVVERLGRVVDGYTSPAERRALNARIGGLALEALLGTSANDIARLADDLGDSLVAVLVPRLGIARLRALRDMRFIVLSNAADHALAQRLGGAAKALGALKGKSASEIRARLQASGFAAHSGIDAGAEVWFHADGSVVKMFATGSDVVPGKPNVTREISRVPGAWGSAEVLATLVDISGAVAPSTPTEARASLVAWFKRAENANRPPSSEEGSELEGYWRYATHPTYVP